MAHVFIPPQMRRFTSGEKEVDVPGATLKEVVDRLEERFPGISEEIVDTEQEDDFVAGLAAVVDGDHTVEGLLLRLNEDAEIHFLPAIAGGSC